MVRTASILGCCLILLTGPALASVPRWVEDPPQSLADCDRLVLDDPDDLHSYSCYWYVARNGGLHREAIRRLEEHLRLRPGDPRAQLYLGILASDLGQARCEDLWLAAAATFAEEGDLEGEVYARTSLALRYRVRGLQAESGEQLEIALDRATASGDAGLEGKVLVDMGWQKYYERDYGSALRVLRRAESLKAPGEEMLFRLDMLDGLAAVSWALGRMTDALGYYRDQLAYLDGRDPFREAGIRRNVALVTRYLVDEERVSRDELVASYRAALDATLRSRNRLAEPGVRIGLASLLEGEEALDQARRALAIARQNDRLSDICWSLRILAGKLLEHDRSRAAEAYRLVDEAASLARNRGDAEHFAQSLQVRADMLWTGDDREAAVADSLAALDAVERIRDLQPEGEARTRVFARFVQEYRKTVSRLLTAEDRPATPVEVGQAFHVLERMRARSLLDTLDAAGATGLLTPAGDNAERLASLLEEIDSIRNELSAEDLPRWRREALLSDLDGKEDGLADLRHRMARENEAYAAMQGPPKDILDRVRLALAPDQAMIAFAVPDIRNFTCFALVVTREDARAVPLPSLSGVRRKVELYLSLLSRRDGSELHGSIRFHRDLLASSLDLLPAHVRRLVLVPDGALHGLPFGALTDPDSGRTLAQRFEIVVAPSAATWVRWKGNPEPAGRRPVLALADPIPSSPRGPLPHARREAVRMGNRLGEGSVVRLGEEATEQAVAGESLADYRMIHLATHAEVHDDEPERSAVLLAPSTDDADGRLSFRDIVSLDLDGQVVLLSACRSGTGPVIGGEGILGLSNAFFQAGARTVVAGLWPVRDRETAALVDAFGAHLAGGTSVAGALALARRERMQRGDPPAAWAGMIVLGDGDLVPFPAGRETTTGLAWIIAFSSGALLLVVAFVLLYRRRPAALPM